MDAQRIRAIALALPEVEEYAHGGLPAFRVRGRRFASMLDDEGLNLMPGEQAIHAWVAQWPQWCSEGWFGRRLVAARIAHAGMAPELMAELVTEAWAARAPKRLVQAHVRDAGHQ